MKRSLVLLALLFSFSLALGRYDARRTVLVREANAIGTTFLRTSLLSQGVASKMRDDLRKYVGARIEFVFQNRFHFREEADQAAVEVIDACVKLWLE